MANKVVEKVVVFGSTGQTGLCSMEHALKRGMLILV